MTQSTRIILEALRIAVPYVSHRDPRENPVTHAMNYAKIQQALRIAEEMSNEGLSQTPTST